MKNFLVSLNVAGQSADNSTMALRSSDIHQPRHLRHTDLSAGTVERTIAKHGSMQPHHVALIDDTTTLTYAQLNDCVDLFSSKLHQQGIRRGDRVGVALEPNVVTVALILALHSIGAAYVALDDSQPAARLAGMAEDAEITFVLSLHGNVPQLASLAVRQVNATELCLGWHSCLVSQQQSQPPFKTSRSGAKNPAQHSADNECHLSTAEIFADTAYVVFTSGSTGRPKGVGITHANLNALMHAWDRVMGFTKHTSLLLSTLTFDASVAELFWPLHCGGTLIIANKDDAQPGGAGIGNLIRKHNIDHLQCTPTRATLLLSDPCDRAALAHIKHLVIGGEALTRSLGRRLLDAGIERVTNAYGPTEATVWAFTHEVTGELPSEIVGIGHPLDGISWAIVDAEGRDVSEVGVLGELVLGGPFVACGYVNRADLTSERFLSRAYEPHPLRALQSYRTGDVVARNPDGTLAFHGRSDEQVKIRGHRVELGEIEAALMTHPRVQHSTVCAFSRNDSNELVAFVVSSPADQAPESAPANPSAQSWKVDSTESALGLGLGELRKYLTAILPPALVPSLIVLVPALPLTTSNKVDRVRVRSEMLEPMFVEQSTLNGGAQFLESAHPRGAGSQTSSHNRQTGLDAMISDFAVVLGAGNHDDVPVEPDTDFFASGGHSMFAVALLARVEARTGVCLPIRALLGAPTPKQLSVIVQTELTTPARFDPLVRFRLSSAPRRLYLVHGAGGNVLRYRNLAGALHDVAEVIGIQAIGVEPGNIPDLTLAAMVDRYTAALLATNETSFEIGGYSDGGVIALHIAHRLREAGKVIRSLTLLDAFVPAKAPTSLRQQITNARCSFATKDTLSVGQWIRGSVVGWRGRGIWDSEGVESLQRMGYVDIYAVNEQAVQSEALPELFKAPALVVRTFEESPTKRRNYAIGFDRQQATVAWVHGPHDELLKPASIPELEAAIRTFFRSV